MTMNVSAKSIVRGAVAVVTPVDGGMYWIERTSNGGNTFEPEIAKFCIIPIGIHPGKWQIFDKLTPVYHDSKVRVISAIKTPKV